MSLYQVQKLLFYLHNDLELRDGYDSDPIAVLKRYDLTASEAKALLDRDIGSLYRMGVNPWLLFQFAHIVGIDNQNYLKQIRGG